MPCSSCLPIADTALVGLSVWGDVIDSREQDPRLNLMKEDLVRLTRQIRRIRYVLRETGVRANARTPYGRRLVIGNLLRRIETLADGDGKRFQNRRLRRSHLAFGIELLGDLTHGAEDQIKAPIGQLQNQIAGARTTSYCRRPDSQPRLYVSVGSAL